MQKKRPMFGNASNTDPRNIKSNADQNETYTVRRSPRIRENRPQSYKTAITSDDESSHSNDDDESSHSSDDDESSHSSDDDESSHSSDDDESSHSSDDETSAFQLFEDDSKDHDCYDQSSSDDNSSLSSDDDIVQGVATSTSTLAIRLVANSGSREITLPSPAPKKESPDSDSICTAPSPDVENRTPLATITNSQKSPNTSLRNVFSFTFATKVFANEIGETIRNCFASCKPDTLLNQKSITELNKNIPRQLNIDGKTIRNPELRTNLIIDKDILDLASLVWDDQDHRSTLKRHGIDNKDSLDKLMQGNIREFLSRCIRRSFFGIMTKAKNNEDKGIGPFQGFEPDEAKLKKKEIDGLLVGMQDNYMTQEAADIIIFRILDQHDLKHVYLLTVAQLAWLVYRMVKQNNAPPNHDLSEEELDEVGSLSDKERNEFVAQMDYICKLKGSLLQLSTALMNRTAIALEMYDPDFNKNMIDIYVEIVEHSSDNEDGTGNLSFELCQGSAKRDFDDYRRFEGHVKIVDRGRYIVGLFHARVFDLKSKYSSFNNSFGIPFGDSIMREIGYTSRQDDLHKHSVKLFGRDKSTCVTLHRLVAIVAEEKGLSIFHEGVLGNLGVHLPEGGNYDRYFEYTPVGEMSTVAIMRQVRVGGMYSNQCDVDHRAGRDRRHLNGLLNCAPTSHRMNTCFSLIRKNANHWCCGLIYMEYKGGNESTEGILSSVLDDILHDIEDGKEFDSSKVGELDLFMILHPIEKWKNSL
jgi:hypothetical protein